MKAALLNRPLLLVAGGLVVGLTLPEYPVNLVLLALLFAVVRQIHPAMLVAVGFVLGVCLAPTSPESGLTASQSVERPALVVSIPRLFEDRLGVNLEIGGHRFVASFPRDADVSLGDNLQVQGTVRPLREGTDTYYLSHGIVGRFRLEHFRMLAQGPRFYRWARDLRQGFVDFTHRTLPPAEAAVVDALCFNVDEGLQPGFRENLQATGTIHIISASGLHVLVFAWLLDRLFRCLPFPRAISLVLLGLVLTFYACAAGLQPAIVRSVVMAMIGLTAYLWFRESDLLSSLALAAIGYLCFVPLAIYDIGFQFSFVTVAAFGLFGREWDELPAKSWRHWAFRALTNVYRTTLIAFVATAPIVAFYFGFVSITTLPANLLVAPLAMLAVALSLGAFGLATLSFPVADFLMQAVGLLVGGIRVILDLLGSLSFNPSFGVAFSGYWLVAFYLLCLGLVRQKIRPA